MIEKIKAASRTELNRIIKQVAQDKHLQVKRIFQAIKKRQAELRCHAIAKTNRQCNRYATHGKYCYLHRERA